MMTQEQFDRLPKYAQYYIQKLESDIKHWKDRLDAMSDENSPITWSSGHETYGLHPHTTIQFELEEGYVQISLNSCNRISLRASGKLIILPSATNSAFIENAGY
jgi:hypothetical protein